MGEGPPPGYKATPRRQRQFTHKEISRGDTAWPEQRKW
nr:MAG TPA: hypothetical protein [Caudoviricetes sp.]